MIIFKKIETEEERLTKRQKTKVLDEEEDQ